MEHDQSVEQDRQELADVNASPFIKRLGFYTRKSGPGWLQAAITLGGGSLAGSLFLGVLLGYSLMWLQPFAMILGVIMLGAIGYVTLSTGQRPFGAINRHVSPVLGWAWLLAAMMANLVWCLPQFALGIGAVQQNLIPALKGNSVAPWIIGLVLFVIAGLVVRAYDRDTKGVRLFELILKGLVGIVVISFFAVVGKLTLAGELNWGDIFKGLIPNFSYLFKPSPVFAEAIGASGANADYWSGIIGGMQRDRIIAAFGTAVGINMTFLLPYSMLRKKWGKEHRGLAIFDLSIGLIVPFVLATACIVIAAGSQFHGQYDDVLNEDGTVIAGMEGGFNQQVGGLLGAMSKDLEAAKASGDTQKVATLTAAIQAGADGLTLENRRLAAMLVERNDGQLALALEKLGGKQGSKLIFGFGVLGMALSTIIILMLINGFCLCEAMGKPDDRNIHFIGCLLPGILGFFSPIIWAGDAKAALAVPTSVIGTSFLPIAYFTFLLLMNSKNLLGDAMLTGGKRVVMNTAMIFATAVATFGSVWAIKTKMLGPFPIGKVGIVALALLFVLGLFGFLMNNNKRKAA